MIHLLSAVNLDNIYLKGCDVQIEISQQHELLKITLDGGYSGSNEIIYFELHFKTVACVYYENNEMWLEQLTQKYDTSNIEKNAYAGVFSSDTADLEKIKIFDPLARLDLTRFLVIGQHCFCEFIAQKELSIQTITLNK